jgi:hypothetical protein
MLGPCPTNRRQSLPSEMFYTRHNHVIVRDMSNIHVQELKVTPQRNRSKCWTHQLRLSDRNYIFREAYEFRANVCPSFFLALTRDIHKASQLGVMPRVVRTAAVSSLAVTSAYGSVSNNLAWLTPAAGSVLSPNDLLSASWCVSAGTSRPLEQVMLTVCKGHLHRESSLLPSVFARLPLLLLSLELIPLPRLI